MTKVLVVDDDRFVRHMLEDLLQENGYCVTVAANAEEALVFCENEDYDLIFTDFDMGKMATGVQFADHLVRKLHKKMKIVLMTGSSITEAEAGPSISCIIRKPCKIGEFLKEVQQVSS